MCANRYFVRRETFGELFKSIEDYERTLAI